MRQYYTSAMLACAAIVLCASTASAGDNFDWKYVTGANDQALTLDREICASNGMWAVKAEVDKKRKAAGLTPLPEPDLYCVHVIAESLNRGTNYKLYARLALKAQGIDSGDETANAPYLKHNEAGRTIQAILLAANAGQTDYQTVIGKTDALHCPLAVDAGATYALGNPNAKSPTPITDREAVDIGLLCYAPRIMTAIPVHGKLMPASKAGLLLGIWLGQHPQSQH